MQFDVRWSKIFLGPKNYESKSEIPAFVALGRKKKVRYGILTEIFHSLVEQNFLKSKSLQCSKRKLFLTSLKAMLARFLCPLNVICKNSKIGRYNEAVGKVKLIFY